MKNKMLKVMCMLNVMLFGFVGTAFAGNAGVKVDIGDIDSGDAGTIVTKINGLIAPISAILIFAAVVMVGFEIIMKRNKADERMESMSSLMWVGIGALVLGSAGLIFNMMTSGN